MPTFVWQAIDNKGKTKSGIDNADSPKALRRALRLDNLFPTKVEVADQKINSKSSKIRQAIIKRLPPKDLVAITRQFGTLLKAGLPIDTSLKAMIEQTKKQQHKHLLISLRTKINEGFTFAKALATYPKIFPNFYISTVAAGEKTGSLDQVLSRLGEYLHISYSTKQKITSALLYPAIITLVAISVIAAMLVFVIPNIVQVFSSVNQKLPGLTLALIAISDFLINYGLYGLIILFVSLVSFRISLGNINVQRKFHKILLKIPIYGNLIAEQNTSRFIRTLGILLESRVDFYEAMKIATNIIDIVPVNEALQNATKMVQEGSSVFIALSKTGYFSPISLNLIASGEKSGTLPEMLLQCAENQDQETLNFITMFINGFEPVIILVMGGVVLTIVMAILVPIFDMNNLIQ